MPFTVVRPCAPPLSVDADDHRLEGAWHVFRRDTVVMGRPRAVVALRLPAADVVRVVRLASEHRDEDAAAMTRRFDVPLEQLEASARVAGAEQVELQAEPRLVAAPLLEGPHVHPFGDGATGVDGDSD